MIKGRGKGKLSHNLMAASCAAVLAVYAAGYSRTREAARRFEIHVRERRPAAPTAPAAASPRPAAAIDVSMSHPGPTNNATATTASELPPAPKPAAPRAARKPAARPVAAPVMTADAMAVAQASSPNAPPEI